MGCSSELGRNTNITPAQVGGVRMYTLPHVVVVVVVPIAFTYHHCLVVVVVVEIISAATLAQVFVHIAVSH